MKLSEQSIKSLKWHTENITIPLGSRVHPEKVLDLISLIESQQQEIEIYKEAVKDYEELEKEFSKKFELALAEAERNLWNVLVEKDKEIEGLKNSDSLKEQSSIEYYNRARDAERMVKDLQQKISEKDEALRLARETLKYDFPKHFEFNAKKVKVLTAIDTALGGTP